MAGSQYTDEKWTAQIAGSQFLRRLYNPLRALITTIHSPCETGEQHEWIGWGEGEGGAIEIDGNKNARKVKVNNFDVTLGLQKTFCKTLTLGVAGSYAYEDISNGSEGSGKNNLYFSGLYGVYRPSIFYTMVALSYGYSSGSLKRSIHIGDMHDHANSKPKLDQYGIYGELGVDLPFAGMMFQPFIGFEANRFFRHHDKEHDSLGLGLKVNKEKLSAAWGRIGCHVSKTWDEIEHSLDLAWDKLLTEKKNKAKASFISFGREYEIYGVPLDANAIDYSLTFSKHLNDSLSFYLEVSGEAWRKAYYINGIAGIEIGW